MISAKEIHSYLQNHTINDACKHFKCSFKELFNYGKTKHFGTFKTLEEAIKARNELIVNNWGMLE